MILIVFQLKTTENFSNVICEACNNEMRNLCAFRKDLIFKQHGLYSYVESEPLIEFEIEEDMPIKNESSDLVEEIKLEDDSYAGGCYNSMVAIEYFESVNEDGEEHLSYEAVRNNYKKNRKEKGSKKNYKRAICGLCGNSYDAVTLQRHIDVSL